MHANSQNLLTFIVGPDLSVSASISAYLSWALIVLIIVVVVTRIFGIFGIGRSFEIDEAEIGAGGQKITLKPNDTDRQIAYKIWIELSTRKIGLEIDLDHDVVVEIYNSWYDFFSITRELLKDVPVSKFRRKDTEKVIRLSIEVLNVGLRPHLTRWQARFRRWYEHAMDHEERLGAPPQEVQKEFPDFKELSDEMLLVNDKLIRYRQKMYELISSAR